MTVQVSSLMVFLPLTCVHRWKDFFAIISVIKLSCDYFSLPQIQLNLEKERQLAKKLLQEGKKK